MITKLKFTEPEAEIYIIIKAGKQDISILLVFFICNVGIKSLVSRNFSTSKFRARVQGYG